VTAVTSRLRALLRSVWISKKAYPQDRTDSGAKLNQPSQEKSEAVAGVGPEKGAKRALTPFLQTPFLHISSISGGYCL